eukprot:13861713-Alexandrium_andersonii.AAC.1
MRNPLPQDFARAVFHAEQHCHFLSVVGQRRVLRPCHHREALARGGHVLFHADAATASWRQ